jgi:hypothetical protein
MEQEKQIMTSGIDESRNNVVDLTKATSETEPSMVTRTIDKTTYVVGLHFKEQGMTFSEVLKRVLKGVG